MINKEEGHTIVEVVVALAIFITVLIPLSTFLTYFVGQKRNERQIVALSLAQHYMEKTLSDADYENEELWEEKNKWRIKKEIMPEDDLVTIYISVYFRRQDRPLIRLMTMRRRP